MRITGWVSGRTRSRTGAQFDVDADGAQLGRDQPVAQVHRPRPQRALGQALALVERRRPLAPGGRAQPGDPAALLVDQHRRVAPDAVAQRGGQPARAAPGSATLRAKRMKPQGSASAKNRRSVRAELRPAAAEDDGAGAIYCSVTGMQAMPRARSASHICRVSSGSSKPATRSR